MTFLAAVFRILGLPVCIIIVLLVYYEGVPFLSNIPFIQYVPVVREILVGRVESERIKARDEALKGYVLLSEKTAAEAERDKMTRVAEDQAKVLTYYKDAYLTELNNQVAEDEKNEKDRLDYVNQQTTKRPLTDSDYQWLRRRELNKAP